MRGFKKTILAISTLSGTIIGVGLFALPYVALQVGFWALLGYFVILGSLVILIHLFFGELALETPDFKRLPGFAELYLGKWGRNFAYVSTIIGIFGALLAYLIIGGEFLTELLAPVFSGNHLLYTIFYFIIGAFLIFSGIKAVAKVEFWGLLLFFIILLAIFLRGFSFIRVENLFLGSWQLGAANWFLPYGVILFSLWGASLIPEVEEILGAGNSGTDKKRLLKIIPIAILIPMIVYLVFTYLILGITGAQTTESALTGLKNVLGDGVVVLALLFGLLTTFTSFIALGLTLKKVLWYDLKLNKNLAWALTCFLPLFLFLCGAKSFIAVIGFVGGVMLGIDGILVLLMYRKSFKSAQTSQGKMKLFLIYPLFLALLLGIIFQISSL